MAINNIIFDFDGTLMDTAPVILTTMRATIAELGLPERSEAEMKATIGLRLEEIPNALFPNGKVDSTLYAETYRRLFHQYNKPGIVKPYPYVIETIEHFSNLGKGLAIASSRSHASLQEFVDQMNLADKFAILIGGNDVKRGKPHPDPVLAILETTGWNAEDTIVVGDAGVDILMGKAARTMTCGVTYGNGTKEELIKADADYLINKFSELKDFIK